MNPFTIIVAFLTAVTEYFKAVNVVLPDIWKGIMGVFQYFQDKNQREKDAIAEQVAAKLRAQEIEAKKAEANVKAAMLIYDKIWKDRFNMVLNFLDNNLTERVIALTLEVDNSEVSNILFDEALSNSAKAMKIVEIMRRKVA